MRNILELILLRIIEHVCQYELMDKQVYTLQEVSEILRVHPSTIRRAIRNGKIHAFKVGIGKRSPVRIPKEEIAKIQLMKYIDNEG